MKRLIGITITILLMFTIACQIQQQNPQQELFNNNKVVNTVDENIKNQIANILSSEVKAINALDLEKYITLINPTDTELIMEQTNWFNDLKLQKIQDFSIKLLGITKIDDNNYKAEVEQLYSRDDKKSPIRYFKRFTKKDNSVYDAGNYFEEATDEHFIIKYTEQNEKLALELLKAVEPIYEEYVYRWKLEPERKIVVKLFDDKEALRQSIKLSMWTCAGWYEFGESVRMYIPSNRRDVDSIAYVIRHEMVHLFTMTKANGNVAYWLAEGLATNYENIERVDYTTNIKSASNRLMSIDQLEAIELEKLEDTQEISRYYTNSELIVSFIIEKYGEEVLDRILDKLAQRQRLEGTGNENDEIYRGYLWEILPQTLGLRDYNEFKHLWQEEIDKVNR